MPINLRVRLDQIVVLIEMSMLSKLELVPEFDASWVVA